MQHFFLVIIRLEKTSGNIDCRNPISRFRNQIIHRRRAYTNNKKGYLPGRRVDLLTMVQWFNIGPVSFLHFLSEGCQSLMIVVVVMIALPTRWSFYESDNNTAQGLLWFYMDGIQSRRAQTFFLTVSNILCVNNWNDSLGKWGFFFLQKGTHTTHAHLLPGVELCSLRSIPDSRLSRHRNDAPLHRATPPTPTIYYPHHLFFFSLKLNYSPERHGTFSRLLASIKAVVNVLQAGASDSLTSTEERGKKCVDESCNMN